jgi:predicted RNA-binding Zn ribbon-like protein
MERADETLLLELLNTTPVVDGVPGDELDDADAATAWLEAHNRPGSAAEWHSVRTARDRLQRVVRGQAAPESLAPLLGHVTQRPILDADGVQWRLDVPAGRTAAVAAVLAWDELRRTSPGRLRPCANDECSLFLIDHSKPNRARWCSMAVCGNRLKARRHYERTRTATNPIGRS